MTPTLVLYVYVYIYLDMYPYSSFSFYSLVIFFVLFPVGLSALRVIEVVLWSHHDVIIASLSFCLCVIYIFYIFLVLFSLDCLSLFYVLSRPCLCLVCFLVFLFLFVFFIDFINKEYTFIFPLISFIIGADTVRWFLLREISLCSCWLDFSSWFDLHSSWGSKPLTTLLSRDSQDWQKRYYLSMKKLSEIVKL
jgi:hypothetical protein